MKWLLPIILLLANLLVWWQVNLASGHNYLTLAVLDIGQGDAIFIEDKVGHQILIDGGPDQTILSQLPKLMPVTDRSLDLLVLTHPHADHVTGLVEVLKRYQVSAVLESEVDYRSAIYDEWQRELQARKIKVILARRGETIKLAGDTRLEVLAPTRDWRGAEPRNVHEAMVVTRLVVASSTGVALLTGDMEQPLEAELLATSANLSAQILKVGHHGSKTSTSEAFLQAVAPQYAVISVGAHNRYGHPHPVTLATLDHNASLIKVWRTDESGTIIFRVKPDGRLDASQL